MCLSCKAGREIDHRAIEWFGLHKKYFVELCMLMSQLPPLPPIEEIQAMIREKRWKDEKAFPYKKPRVLPRTVRRRLYEDPSYAPRRPNWHYRPSHLLYVGGVPGDPEGISIRFGSPDKRAA